MNISRNNGELIVNSTTSPKTGVVFLYANWSESSVYLRYLVGLLEDYPKIDLYVYDIDEGNVTTFMTEYNVLSHGWGETFWLFEGKVISKVLHYKKEGTSAVEYTKSLNELITECSDAISMNIK
jgi:hypothetical protein